MNSMDANSMWMVEHLGELRKRIFLILIVFTICLVAGFFAVKPILEYFKSVQPAANMNWNVFAPWDGFKVYMRFAVLVALSVTGPFALYQIWSFMKPGLREAERSATLQYIPYTIIFFVVGLSFAYFVVFPLTFSFITSFNKSLEMTETYGITQYFSFMFNILILLSLLFELPVVVMFLTRLGLLNPEKLSKWRKPAYMVLLVASTLVTPPDVISVLLVAIPLILLYEFSLVFSRSIYRKRLAQETS